MLNKIWCFFILISIMFGILSGNSVDVNTSIFESIEDSVSIVISLLGGISFWNGIMNILKNTSLIEKIKRFLNPLIKLIFYDIDVNSEAGEDITMNMTANILGLGNAATPCGLRAVEKLQKENILLFILINTASIQLIPTNIISIRSSLNSQNPTGIILGVWFSSIIAFISMLVITKTYIKVTKYD